MLLCTLVVGESFFSQLFSFLRFLPLNIILASLIYVPILCSRFALDIDLDAPKVRVPIRSCGSSKCDSHFLLDFGHFMLRTMVSLLLPCIALCFIFQSLPFVYNISSQGSQSDERRHSLYSRFFISGRDIAALFRDCGPECQKCSDYSNQPIVSPLLKEESHNVYPLLDQCGMAVIVDQVTISACFPSFLHTIYVFG